MIYASRTARRYARALTAVVDDLERLKGVLGELERVSAQLAEIPELGQVLEHHSIPLGRKMELLEQSMRGPAVVDSGAADDADGEPAGEGLSDATRHFLRLLAEHHRVPILDEVVAALQATIDEREGVVRATVTTAVPLLKAEREMIERKLAEVSGARRLELETKVSRKVVGGVIIHIGDHVIDASVRTYLDTLRDRLRRTRVAEFTERGFLPLDVERLRAEASGPGDAD